MAHIGDSSKPKARDVRRSLVVGVCAVALLLCGSLPSAAQEAPYGTGATGSVVTPSARAHRTGRRGGSGRAVNLRI